MKTRNHELRRVTEDALHACGIRGAFGFTGGGHCKIEFQFAGRNHSIFFSNTASDWRATRKHEAFMRRKLTDIGALRSA